MLTIKVLGSGCQNCQNLASNAQRAITNLAIEAKVEKVTDHAEIMKYKILATPGLVINEKVVSAGRVPNEAEIVTFLTNTLRDRMKKKVLFLCTGNSVRSQMAEAIVNARLGETWEAASAGTNPAGYVHPKALEVGCRSGSGMPGDQSRWKSSGKWTPTW